MYGSFGDGHVATNAECIFPTSVSVDSLGNVYIVDMGDQLIRKVTASTGTIATLARNGIEGFSGDGEGQQLQLK